MVLSGKIPAQPPAPGCSLEAEGRQKQKYRRPPQWNDLDVLFGIALLGPVGLLELAERTTRRQGRGQWLMITINLSFIKPVLLQLLLTSGFDFHAFTHR
jgi:hypothetical protein